MISEKAVQDLIEKKVGWEKALGILENQEDSDRSQPNRSMSAHEVYVKLIFALPEARSALIEFPPPNDPINPLSDADMLYATSAGAHAAFLVDRLIDKFAPDAKQILDFGCGTGRLTRYLIQFLPDRNFAGCDVVESAISYLNESGLRGDFRVMPNAPAAPFAENSFDVVFAWSIFTHYSETRHLEWLRDIHRMLKPGGILLATVHSSDAIDTQRGDPRMDGRVDFDALEKEVNETGYSFAPIYVNQWAPPEEVDGTHFGQTFISESYIRSNWSSLFDILEISPAAPGWQDMVVLRKKSEASLEKDKMSLFGRLRQRLFS